MSGKKIVIVGGGVAGLSAGIFAQRNGFESVILEKNAVAGGECTGWDRRGHHIDGCIHWLTGTLEGTRMNDLWKSVGALEGVEIFHPDSFLVFEHESGTVVFHRDLDRLERSWIELSPQDREAIEELCAALRRLRSFEIPVDKPKDLMSIPEKIRLVMSMKDAGPILQKYGKTDVREFADRFTHPALRAALGLALPEGYSATSVVFPLAIFSKGQASIPMGGSRAFALRMAEKYRALGGTIETSCEAVKLETGGGRVRKVVCGDGRGFEADYVVAACDAKVLYDRLLEGRHPDPAFERRFADPENYPLASEIMVSLGYEGTMEGRPRTLSFPTDPIEISGRTVARLQITHHGHEPSWAPAGHTVITCDINQFHDDYEAWNVLSRDREAYRREKQRIGTAVLGATQKRFPEMKDKLTLLDVVTPKTYERYCNAYRGAFMPFMLTTAGKMLDHPGKVKSLKNLFLSGQWLQPPGGLPVAVLTGKDTIMRICRKEKRVFAGL